MRNFRDFEVYNRSIELVKSVFKILDKYPDNQKYALVSQISRCSISIPSNIAEGSSRKSEKDFTRFLEISLGSSFELETQLLISKELGFVSVNDFDGIASNLTIIQKQLNTLITKIRSKSR